MSALRTERRCDACASTLYLKLSRERDGSLDRRAYCPSCDRRRDVTSSLARRAALVVASTREVA